MHSDFSSVNKSLISQKQRETCKQLIKMANCGKSLDQYLATVSSLLVSPDLVVKKMASHLLVRGGGQLSDSASLIMATNTLLQECRNPNPSVRTMALRALWAVSRTNAIPVLKELALRDGSPHVRRAALQAFFSSSDADSMEWAVSLLKDSDPGVVASLASVFPASPNLLAFLWHRLPALPEWYQLTLLQTLRSQPTPASFSPLDLLNLLDPLLTHPTNPAVALEAQNLFLHLVRSHNLQHLEKQLIKHALPYLCALLHHHNSELVYAVLSHLDQLCAKDNVHALRPHFKHFFINLADPPYVEKPKFALLIQLLDESNVGEILYHILPQIRKEHFTVDLFRKLVESKAGSEQAFLHSLMGHLGLLQASLGHKLLIGLCHLSQQQSGATHLLSTHFTTLPLQTPLVWLLTRHLPEDYHTWETLLDTAEEPDPSLQLALTLGLLKLFFKVPGASQELLGRQLERGCSCPSLLVQEENEFYQALLSHNADLAREIVQPLLL